MINLNVEIHYLKNNSSVAEYLAQSIFLHYGMGKIAVIAHNPKSLTQKTESEWRELYSDSNIPLRFSAQIPEELLNADVTFATLKDFLKVPPICEVLYVTHPIERRDLYLVTRWMPAGSTVILSIFKP